MCAKLEEARELCLQARSGYEQIIKRGRRVENMTRDGVKVGRQVLEWIVFLQLGAEEERARHRLSGDELLDDALNVSCDPLDPQSCISRLSVVTLCLVSIVSLMQHARRGAVRFSRIPLFRISLSSIDFTVYLFVTGVQGSDRSCPADRVLPKDVHQYRRRRRGCDRG